MALLVLLSVTAAGVHPVTAALLGDERWYSRVKATPRPSAIELADSLDTFGAPALEHGARYLTDCKRPATPRPSRRWRGCFNAGRQSGGARCSRPATCARTTRTQRSLASSSRA